MRHFLVSRCLGCRRFATTASQPNTIAVLEEWRKSVVVDDSKVLSFCSSALFSGLVQHRRPEKIFLVPGLFLGDLFEERLSEEGDSRQSQRPRTQIHRRQDLHSDGG